jgi:hypothetical protein
MPNEVECFDYVPRQQHQPPAPKASAQHQMKHVQLQMCKGFSVTLPRVEEGTCEVQGCPAVAGVRCRHTGCSKGHHHAEIERENNLHKLSPNPRTSVVDGGADGGKL